MSDSSLPIQASRDYVRVALVACCVLAVVLAAVLVPTLAGSGLGDSPASSMIPGDELSTEADGGTGSQPGESGGEPGEVPDAGAAGGGTGGGQLGALNPGDSTDVGGAVDVEENPYQSQETDVHLTVRSSAPAYWRTGSYDRYTGSGWAQTGDSRAYDGRVGTRGIRGERAEYRVTLERPATALPTVWRPATVDGPAGLTVTDGRALRSERSLDPGTTYEGVSYRAPRDPAVLRSTGRDYPAEIADRYAATEGMSDRVARKTAEITADADNPYDEARAIETWLESNKDYSLNVSRTSDSMAETFVFEMERGYCEYFATSMVVMLRSQGIPARYVVGYSTGQQVAPDTYRVRGMNAHAWVEVYFPDVGWVKFDPTPGSDRLQQERQSMQEDLPEEEYAPSEEGSPGETEPPEEDSPDEDRETAGEYEVSLNRSVVPGAVVTATVTLGGEPAPGRTVLFNGDPVGTTNEAGEVTGRVPYAEELSITVEDAGSAAALFPPGALVGEGRLYRIATPGQAANVTLPVETNATVAVAGERVAGATVRVTATIADVPVRDGAVLVDGERLATTDSKGRAEITLPPEPGNVTVAVERDPVRAETTLALPDLEVAVRPTAPLALPLTGAIVEVRSAGDPVGGAPVELDGERVATTDVNGTATVSLPAGSSATVSVTALGLTRESTVSGLFLNLFLVVAGLVFLLAGALLAAYRRGYTPRDILAALRRVPGLAVQYSQWLLVAAARLGDFALARALDRLRRTWSYLLDAARGRVSLADLRTLLLAWLREKRRELRTLRGGDAPVGRPADAANGASESGTASAYRDVRTAWARFRAEVSLRRTRTKTPGEIARHAVRRDGLPPDAVRELRDAFREVEYGSRPPDERVDRVERALSIIEDGEGE
jgi:transglutaminase-like putative cysteine protease